MRENRIHNYAVEYFSGAQAALFIGDTFVDEITSWQFRRFRNKVPIFGYASTHFDTMAQGQVLVQGSFSINFKEAGYLWLVLDRYSALNGRGSVLGEVGFGDTQWTTGQGANNSPFYRTSENSTKNEQLNRQSIERILDAEANILERNKLYTALTEQAARLPEQELRIIGSDLIGYASTTRYNATRQNFTGSDNNRILGQAENIFEAFEDAVWDKDRETLINYNRHADDPRLNPFDIFLTYGDFVDNYDNHTIRRLTDVHILGTSERVVISGEPIQEVYEFIARDSV